MPTWNEIVTARSVGATYDPIWGAADELLAVCTRSLTNAVITAERLRKDIQAIGVAGAKIAPLLPTIDLDATTAGRLEAMQKAAGDWVFAAEAAAEAADAALVADRAAVKALADRGVQLPGFFAAPTTAQIAPTPALQTAAAALQTAVLKLIEPPELAP